jgi:hypothetical protein
VPLSADGPDDARTPAPPPALAAPPCCAARPSCRLSLDSAASGGGAGADGLDSVARIFTNSAWRAAVSWQQQHHAAQLMSPSESDGYDDLLVAPSFCLGADDAADAENLPPYAHSELMLPRGGGGGHGAGRRVSLSVQPRMLFDGTTAAA